MHLSNQDAKSDENEILDALASPTERGCNLTFICCHHHSGVRSNELADMAVKEGTSLEQKEVSHHYVSVKATLQQATKEPPITYECLCHVYGKRDKKENHK